MTLDCETVIARKTKPFVPIVSSGKDTTNFDPYEEG
jgi:hypothetical protein